MASFEAQWKKLQGSDTAQAEAAQAQALVAFAREHKITYQLAVSDAATGAPIPIAALGQDPSRKLRVKVTADHAGKKLVLTWDPRDPSNVLPLLRE